LSRLSIAVSVVKEILFLSTCSTECVEGHPIEPQQFGTHGGDETVLLAEDDLQVRTMVADVLNDQGYSVLQAANGDEALRLSQEHGDQRIDLLVTDLVCSLTRDPPAIIQEDPRALLYHARDYATEPIQDTVDARRKGWRHMAQFGLVFFPSQIEVRSVSEAFKEAGEVSACICKRVMEAALVRVFGGKIAKARPNVSPARDR